jgi:hypothetical protein
LAAAALLAGCSNYDPTQGYTFSSPYPSDVKTVSVPIFNRGALEFRRDLEIKLTEAVCKRIESETHYKVVNEAERPGQRRADTLLTGTLVKVAQHVLSFDPNTGQAREIQMALILDFTWTDLRSGKVRVEKKNFPVSATYIPLQPFSEDFFQGSQDAFDRVAEQIVRTMQRDW